MAGMAKHVGKGSQKESKEKIAALRGLSKAFLDDRKNANNLVDIMMQLETEEEDVLLACVKSVHKVFMHLINHNEMYLHTIPVDEADKIDLDTDGKYRLWLQEQYTECRQRLLQLLTHQNALLQELTLCTLMKFIEAEGNTPLRNVSAKYLAFPVHFFEQVVHQLLSSDLEMQPLLQRFQEYLEYDDVRYYAMKHVLANIKQSETEDMTTIYLSNVMTLLEQISIPSPSEDERMVRFLTRLPAADTKLKINTYKEHKKAFTSVWLELLQQKLSTGLYKRVLVSLHEKVMPFMTSPILLADFLTESFNIGGVISLLALNGIFILINSYNLYGLLKISLKDSVHTSYDVIELYDRVMKHGSNHGLGNPLREYPDFFKKLYSLFDPTVFHVKYRARFFFLADLFLTSTHIPAYLVAAFAKKLARLCLTAPPSGLSVAIPLIYNLLIRHPNCKVLLHRPDGSKELTSDPFKMEEPDPAHCNAMESSLWELKTLQTHYHYTVSREAKRIEQPLPREETDLSNLLETTIDNLFAKEAKKKLKTVPTTFDQPKGIFCNKEDQFTGLWLLE